MNIKFLQTKPWIRWFVCSVCTELFLLGKYSELHIFPLPFSFILYMPRVRGEAVWALQGEAREREIGNPDPLVLLPGRNFYHSLFWAAMDGVRGCTAWIFFSLSITKIQNKTKKHLLPESGLLEAWNLSLLLWCLKCQQYPTLSQTADWTALATSCQGCCLTPMQNWQIMPGLDSFFFFFFFCLKFHRVCWREAGNGCQSLMSLPLLISCLLSGWLVLYIFNGILYCFSCTAPGYLATCIFVDGCNESIANNNLSLEGTEFAKRHTIHTCWKCDEKSPG